MTALRILYLEDNPDHVLLVAEALQCQFPGSQVETASLFPEALACLGSRHYDAVLVNAHLHGESIIHKLQDLVLAAGGTPVIVVSGNGDEKGGANAIKHGAADYLVKSRESLEVLPYLIQRLIKKRRAPVEHRGHTHAPAGVNHLLSEIDHVARRIHQLQDVPAANSIAEATDMGNSPAHDMVIQGLRDEIHQLRQMVLQLVETNKTGKSRE